jgi:hypothetical protein
VPLDAAAVVVNVTAVDAPFNGYVTAHACSPTPPNASSLNYTAGVNRGNEIVALLDPTGKICLFTSRYIHLTVDVVGYLPAGTDYHPLPQPSRLLDTRPGFTTADGLFQGGGPRPAGSILTLDVGGRAGVPAGATTLTVNLTAVDAANDGYATVFDCAGAPPNASSLNYRTKINGGNDVIVGVGSGKICIYTHKVAHLTADVSGFTLLTD